MAGMLSKLWDDVAGGSPPEKGMKQLRKQNSVNSALFATDGEKSTNFGRRLSLGDFQSTTPPQSIPMKKPVLPMLDISESPCSLGSTPPTSPSMMAASPSSTYPKEKGNLWRSVFHSGQSKVKRNLATGADKVEESTSPTVYDWVVITALEG